MSVRIAVCVDEVCLLGNGEEFERVWFMAHGETKGRGGGGGGGGLTAYLRTEDQLYSTTHGVVYRIIADSDVDLARFIDGIPSGS